MNLIPTEISQQKLENQLKDYRLKAKRQLLEDHPLLNVSFERNPQQIPFMESKTAFQGAFGGKRSGKTRAGAIKTVIQLLPANFVPKNLLPYKMFFRPIRARVCCINYAAGIEKIIRPNIDALLPAAYRRCWKEKTRTYDLPNGSLLELLSYQQERKDYGGVSCDWIWDDEEPPKELHDENLARLMDTNGIMITTMTAVEGMSHLYFEFIDNPSPDYSFFYFDTEENRHLDKNSIARMTQGMSEEEKLVSLKGHAITHSFMVFGEWRDVVHVHKDIAPIPDDWLLVSVTDPHPQTPTCTLWFAINPDGDIFQVDELMQGGLLASEYCQQIKDREANYLKHEADLRLIDPASHQKNTMLARNNSVPASIYDEFCEGGIFCLDANNDFDSGILKMREYLHPADISGKAKLLVCERCTYTIRTVKRYIGKPITDGQVQNKMRPKMKDDHAMACWRYFANQQIEYYNPKMADIIHERKVKDKLTGW